MPEKKPQPIDNTFSPNSVPEATLFANGNALYFDGNGQQIPDFQKHGWRGLHLFVEEYPDAPVYFGIWGEMRAPIHENLLDNIAKPDVAE